MSAVTMRELLEAGVHFGHQTRRWNPKMRRYIFGERGGIYIIDLQQSIELLQTAHDYVRNISERGGTVLFVGTKKQSQDAVEEQARRVSMPYVNHRWLGGLLTNYRTIQERIASLHELRRQKTEGQLELLPPKERQATLSELEKLETNLGGMADTKRLPDAVIVIDMKKEALAVREARRLGIPVDRPGRHQLRPGRRRLRHPRQRRRHPLDGADHARAGRRGRRGPGQDVKVSDFEPRRCGGPGRRRDARGRRGRGPDRPAEGEAPAARRGRGSGRGRGRAAPEARRRAGARAGRGGRRRGRPDEQRGQDE